MKHFINALYKKNPLLVSLAGLGPLILLSSRLAYSLAFTVIVSVYTGFMLLCTFLIEKFMEKGLRTSARLLAASVTIASLDMAFSALLPQIRSDFGVLLPLLLGATGISLIPFNSESPGYYPDALKEFSEISDPSAASDREGEIIEAEDNSFSTRILSLLGRLLGYALVLNLFGLIRELISYGTLNLHIQPWSDEGTGGTAFVIMGSTFGVLVLLAYGRALYKRVVR